MGSIGPVGRMVALISFETVNINIGYTEGWSGQKSKLHFGPGLADQDER